MRRVITPAIVLCVLFVGCDGGQQQAELIEGGVYAEKGEDGEYSVVKVLVVDDSAYHLRIYANTFTTLPTKSDLSKLTLGGFGKPEGVGIGHAPVAKAGKDLSSYTLIEKQSVSEDELQGYRIWEKQ